MFWSVQLVDVPKTFGALRIVYLSATKNEDFREAPNWRDHHPRG